MGRWLGRKGRLEAPLIPLARGHEGVRGHQDKSQGSPEPSLLTRDVDFLKCAKQASPPANSVHSTTQYLTMLFYFVCVCWGGGRGQGAVGSGYSGKYAEWKNLKSFAFVFPVPLSTAPVYFQRCHLSFIFWPGWACVRICVGDPRGVERSGRSTGQIECQNWLQRNSGHNRPQRITLN